VTLAGDIAAALAREGTPERAVQEKAYLKSSLQHLGVTVPRIRSVTLAALPAALDHDAVVALAEELWARPVHELRMAAVEVLTRYVSVLGPADLPLLERLVRESRTWALSDGLGASVIAGVVEREPDACGPALDRWAGDGDFWIRRTALLALLPALRRGEGDFERFGRYADGMLEEKELFLRKAIGWVLRDTGRKRPDLVADWLAPRLDRVSGLTLREAVKHLPPERRDALLAAYHHR
jgi:3-methyladenine DNA glycosylase AlkD